MRSACPHCKTVNTVPAEASGNMVLCPQCNKSYFADPIPEDESEGYRACPFCHERIRAGAKKCRWCQSLLEETTTTPAQNPGVGSAAPAAPAAQPVAPSKPSGQEEELCNLHPTWKRLLGPLSATILLLILTIPFLRRLEFGMYVVLLIFILCLVWFLKCFIDIYTTHYVITNERLSVKTGIFSREEIEIRISDIRAVWLKQNILEQFLKFGDVLIGTSATAGAEISIADIDNPREVLDLLHDLTRV